MQGNEFYKAYSSFTVVPKKPNVLFAFLVGNGSIYSESMSDECMIDVIAELFGIFFPNLNIPRPRNVIRSKWSSNGLVKGSYSFVKVGSTMNDVNTLAKPVNNKLFFIGEATTPYIGKQAFKLKLYEKQFLQK